MVKPVTVIIDDEDDSVHVDPITGAIETTTPDGSVVVDLEGYRKTKKDDGDFYENLVEKIDPMQLSTIGNDLHDAISADDSSRQGYLDVRARALDLLGTQLKPPKSISTDSGSATEGLSSVTNPLLLEALLRGWANAQGEFLPADGPVKIRDDGEETKGEDELAEAFERDFNHYLTKVATEYYPETSHMLLWGTYFSGSGFKKVYRCPMLRRPTSASVSCEDLIVSDTTKDLKSCERITHQIKMRKSVMKRMQLLGAYKQMDLPDPPAPQVNVVEQKVAAVQGTAAQQSRPEDQPFILWETQCELDLPEYAPKKFKDEGIPLPYLVTLDKDTREILAIRRDWEEDDEECERNQMYIKWPYVPGPGFYGTGLLHILGNSSAALTACWQEALDAGQFASFPGGLISKLGGRQNTSNFRMGIGEFAPVETNQLDIRSVVMPMPYKDVTPGLMAMIDKVTEQSKALSGVADIPTSEGIQNVPVGTMLAQIEQATKVIAAAHKGQHQAQSMEFDLFVELFRKHPEDFWRGNKICPPDYWNEEKLIAALQNCNLVPVSDPNVPSHLHRVMKAMALLTLQSNPAFAPIMSAKETLTRVLAVLKESPVNLIIEPPPMGGAQPEPDKMIAAQAKMKDSDTKMNLAAIKAQEVQQKGNIALAEAASKERLEASNLRGEQIIHQYDAEKERNRAEANRVKELSVIAQAQRAQAHTERMDMHKAGLERRDRTLAEGGAVLESVQQQCDEDERMREHEHREREHQHTEREHELKERELEIADYVAKHPPKPAAPKKKK